jgi:hypothetical protein
MSIIKATRAHYAALQHRPSADRVPLYFSVQGYDHKTLVAGSVWVKAPTEGRRKAEMTKLQNRLAAMYSAGFVDAAASIHVWYSRGNGGDSRTWVHVNGVPQ